MSRSRVLEFPAADREESLRHLRSKLSLATDPSDVAADLADGDSGFLVLDARSHESYAEGHVPGAISFPHREMNEKSVSSLPRDTVIVTYCDGIGCNASTKAAWKLAQLGFPVKEMLGGLDWWRRDGHPVETGAASSVRAAVTCGC